MFVSSDVVMTRLYQSEIWDEIVWTWQQVGES